MTPEQIAEKRREAIEANETGETFSRRDIIDLCDALAERDAEIERLQQVVGQVSMFNQMNNDLENECGELSTRVAELEEKNEQMKSELFQAARAKQYLSEEIRQWDYGGGAIPDKIKYAYECLNRNKVA